MSEDDIEDTIPSEHHATCSCATCESGGCSPSDVKVVETYEVYTPYSSTIEEVWSKKMQYNNYTPYDLFSLKSKLTPMLREIDAGSPSFEHKVKGDDMIMVVSLYNGSIFKPITNSEDQQRIQAMVDKAVEIHKDDVLLIHDKFPITLDGVTMDKVWLHGILKCMKGYDDGALYINLREDRRFNDTVSRMIYEIVSFLRDLYVDGCIVLDPSDNIDKEMITNWDLEPVYDDRFIHPTLTPHKPRWINRWLAPSPTSFLLNIRSGQPWIAITIPNNKVARHTISVELDKAKFRYAYCDTEILVWVRNIIRADIAYSKILKGISKAYGFVTTDMEKDIGSIQNTNNTVEYNDLEYGRIRSIHTY